MTEATAVPSDEEFRSRNADINTIGRGILWSLLALLPPVYLFFLSRRILPNIQPWVAAIVGTLLLFIPLVGPVVGIVLLVYSFKRIGGRFIVGQIVFYAAMVVVALSLALTVPMMMQKREESASPAPASAPAAQAADSAEDTETEEE